MWFELDPAEFVVALFALAVDLVADDLRDWKCLAAHVARNLVLVVNLKDDLRRRAHQAVGTARTLVVISFAAFFAEQLSAF